MQTEVQGTVAEEDPFREIMKKIAEVYEAEKGRPSLYPLDEAFYSDVIKFLRHLWDRYLTSQESPRESAKAPLYLEEYRNFKRILTQIYLRREKKIVRLAISAAYGGEVNTDPLTTTETHLLNEISKALKWHREVSLGDYLYGVSPSPSVDTTTEEFSTADVVSPPPQSIPARSPPRFTAPGVEGVEEFTGKDVVDVGGGRGAVEEDRKVKEEGWVEGAVKGEVENASLLEGGLDKGKGLHETKESFGENMVVQVTAKKDRERVFPEMDSDMERIPMGSGGGGVEMKSGELFGLKEVLVLEKEVGEIVTAREERLYLRKGEVLYTDREFMEAIEKGKFGRILRVED